MTKRVWAVAAAVAWLGASAAQGAKRDFQDCDGLRPPGDRNGGMAGPAGAAPFPIPGAGHAEVAVTACTDALADPRLLPAATLRRAHLLRARALAKLQAADADGALADLDAAAAAAGPLAQDPLYARSMGVSLTLARAAALQVKGDRDAARRLATEAAAARPYSIAVQSMAALIRQRARDLAQGGDAPYTALLPLTPQAYRLQFGADIEAGRFAQAAAEYPRLNQAFPKPGPVLPPFLNANADASTLITSMLDGAAAGYALAATGQPAAARALLVNTETKLEAALTPASDRTGVAQPPSPIAGPLREAWRRARLLADARIAVAEGRPTEALKALIGTELPVGAAGVELLTALQAALPAGERALAPDPAALAAKLTARRKAEQLEVAALRRAMPLPETSGNLADYEGAGNRFLAGLFVAGGATDGFRSKTDAATGITTVAFVGKSSSGPAVEELTLLRAADLARQAGKRGLLIVGRRDYAQTLTMTRMGVPLSSTPAGYKTELDVRFVDPAALPADLAPERARVMDADQVYAALASIYIARAGAKSGG